MSGQNFKDFRPSKPPWLREYLLHQFTNSETSFGHLLSCKSISDKTCPAWKFLVGFPSVGRVMLPKTSALTAFNWEKV